MFSPVSFFPNVSLLVSRVATAFLPVPTSAAPSPTFTTEAGQEEHTPGLLTGQKPNGNVLS